MKKIFIAVSLVVSCTIQAESFEPIQLQKLNQAAAAINALYVDSVNQEQLVENAVEGMLKNLDPHSTYIPQKEVQRANETIDGSFEGIGIQFQMLKDTLFVVQTISGCPAQKVGILPSDRLISVDGKNIAGIKMPTSDIMKLLRGPRGTTVSVNVIRQGVTDPIEFTITRDKIPIYSVDAAYMIAPNIGYIKINSFSSTTLDEFHKALKSLQKQKMKQLILDLQGNGGGLLQAAIDLSDEFLSPNKLIVYTKGVHQRKSIAQSTDKGMFESGDLVVLIDEYSASASEIVSGALQDWDRALIIGRRSFGKGLVQRPVPLFDGSLMRLTVARYYTPTGRNIQKPYNKGSETYQKDLIERYNNGELQHSDSIHFPDSLKYTTLRLGRTVYGGGGIMPDIFVPLDTARFTVYHRNILAKGIINSTVVEYVEKNRKNLTDKYKNIKEYELSFSITDELLNTLRQKATDTKINCSDEEFNLSKPILCLQMKAMIARDIFDNAALFKILNTDDAVIKKAIETLSTNYDNFRLNN
ncbi:MAG: S41 family peptidase [Sphingobacteriia bacterium]|nr:S41 family peptidase [Sphingobacteriia bacterium]